MQDKRDFCPCLKSILLRFFKTFQMNEKPLLAMKGNFSLNDDGIHAEKLEYQNLSEYHKIYSKNWCTKNEFGQILTYKSIIILLELNL